MTCDNLPGLRSPGGASPPTRRRLLIAAGATAVAAAAGPAGAFGGSGEGALYRWRGTALGASAEMLLDADSPAHGERLARDCLAEIERLEAIFSLFVPDSAISRLNREGRLSAPPPEMIALLALCRRLWEASGGAFDPTVQPLWRALAEDAPAERLAKARAALGLDKLRISPQEVAFAAPGMAITLNGIAQGYMTDRVAGLLRRRGLKRTLLQLGETRVLGRRPDGAAWQVHVGDALRPGRTDEVLALEGGALAVSAAQAGPMPGALGQAHILDPARGAPVRTGRSVAVTAPAAALADGLSTALMAAGTDATSRLLGAFPAARAHRLA